MYTAVASILQASEAKGEASHMQDPVDCSGC